MGSWEMETMNVLTLEGKDGQTNGGRSQRRKWVGCAQNQRKSRGVVVAVDMLGSGDFYKNVCESPGPCGSVLVGHRLMPGKVAGLSPCQGTRPGCRLNTP